MKKSLILAIISAIVGMIAGYALFIKAIPPEDFRKELIDAQFDYIDNCEALLDSVCNWKY